VSKETGADIILDRQIIQNVDKIKSEQKKSIDKGDTMQNNETAS